MQFKHVPTQLSQFLVVKLVNVVSGHYDLQIPLSKNIGEAHVKQLLGLVPHVKQLSSHFPQRFFPVSLYSSELQEVTHVVPYKKFTPVHVVHSVAVLTQVAQETLHRSQVFVDEFSKLAVEH